MLEKRGQVTMLQLVTWTLLGVFWVCGVYQFLMELVFPAYSAAASHKSILAVLFAADVVLTILGLLLMRNKWDWIILGSFVVIWLISSIINGSGLMMMLNGVRYYIFFLFILPIIRYLCATPERTAYFFSRLDRSFYIFLWIQFPCIIFQLLKWGAGDHGGGSLGNLNSGVISALIYLLSFYLMLRKWDRNKSYLDNLRQNWLLIFLLIPSFLNETKISFIFFAMYFFFLIPMDKKFIKRLTVLVPIMVVAIVGTVYIYNSVLVDDDVDVTSAQFITDYTLGDDVILDLIEIYVEEEQNDGITDDYARGAKLLATWLVLKDKPWSMWIGFGPGQFKGGNTLERTDFAKRFRFLIDGTQTMLMAWVLEFGFVGLLWSIGWVFIAFRIFRKTGTRNLQLQSFLIIMYALLFFYNIAFIHPAFSIPFIALVYISTRREPKAYIEAEEGNNEGGVAVKS